MHIFFLDINIIIFFLLKNIYIFWLDIIFLKFIFIIYNYFLIILLCFFKIISLNLIYLFLLLISNIPPTAKIFPTCPIKLYFQYEYSIVTPNPVWPCNTIFPTSIEWSNTNFLFILNIFWQYFKIKYIKYNIYYRILLPLK